jgi:nicotinate-nucleotide pyrophosphorylase (carboxylating)
MLFTQTLLSYSKIRTNFTGMELEYLSGLDTFIESALKEDIGDGDHTTLSCVEASKTGSAELRIKDDGILAGVELARKIFYTVDPGLKLSGMKNDGDPVKKGEVAFVVTGSSRSILQAERLVLNCMQRMSGIATTTRSYVQKLQGLHTRILDTRKTTPNFRIPEKWAVHIGGGVNHRFGLFDMILIKDNHIDYAGGVAEALLNAKRYLENTGKNLKIEVEARTLNDVEIILRTGVAFRVLLDNFTVPQMKEAVAIIGNRLETEASGGITYETIRDYAECGVDYISVGALTHSIKSLDLSLKAVL